ncbi:MAG: hypothetical protein ACXQTZ_01545 [Candidatus Alkanophagales archaeon]
MAVERRARGSRVGSTACRSKPIMAEELKGADGGIPAGAGAWKAKKLRAIKDRRVRGGGGELLQTYIVDERAGARQYAMGDLRRREGRASGRSIPCRSS